MSTKSVTRPRVLKHWMVVTPEYQSLSEYIDGYSLYEPACDVVSVEAYTKREALIAGVAEMRRKKLEWIRDQESDKASPFSGLKAESALCSHGYCWCDICTDKPEWSECKECMIEWEVEAENV